MPNSDSEHALAAMAETITKLLAETERQRGELESLREKLEIAHTALFGLYERLARALSGGR